MYNYCNSCGVGVCQTAINILNQIAGLVCGGTVGGQSGGTATGGCYCHHGNGTTGNNTNGVTGNGGNGCYQGRWQGCYGNTYSFPVTGRVYVTGNGWCTTEMNVLLNGQMQNGQTVQTQNVGTTQTCGYGGYGGYGRCGCAFQALNF